VAWGDWVYRRDFVVVWVDAEAVEGRTVSAAGAALTKPTVSRRVRNLRPRHLRWSGTAPNAVLCRVERSG
jgi:hypothetical protein